MNYQLLKEYKSNKILNPYFMLIQLNENIVYFEYLDHLVKPEKINCLIGIELEIPKKYLSCKDIQQLLDSLTVQNNLLHINHNTLFFTLFNMLDTEIINSISYYLFKYNIHAGIYITDKMTSPTQFIENTNKQFNNCKTKQCLYSILNDYFE